MDVKPVLFLDLDGTVRRSKTGEFIDGPEDVQIIEGRKEALERYYNEGWILVGITNQGGVAHGHKTTRQVTQENLKTVELLEGMITSIFFSPYHPDGDDDTFGHKSLLRKPFPGMLVQAELELIQNQGVLPAYDHSLMVGDREEDRECAENAGIDFQWAEEFFDDADG